MRMALVDELEDFVRRGVLWDPAELARLVETLEVESRVSGDAIPAQLAQPFARLLGRIQAGVVDRRTIGDVEAVVYPRLWKIMEAVRDGLPDGEVRVRIEVFARRLADSLVEQPADVGR